MIGPEMSIVTFRGMFTSTASTTSTSKTNKVANTRVIRVQDK